MYNLYDKKNCIVDIRALKKKLHHGLLLEKVHSVIESHQEDLKTEFGKEKPKNILRRISRGFLYLERLWRT